MDAPKSNQTRFFGYPRAVEGPTTIYYKKPDANPIFRGLVLVYGAWIVTSFKFLQRLLWTNAGFGRLRGLPYLHDYHERWDPTVIPIAACDCDTEFKLDAGSFPVLPEKTPGRYHSISDYHAMYMSGELTPIAVAGSLIPLIRRDIASASQHSIAFIDSRVETIMAAAKASTLRFENGHPLSIMDGVPTAIKDQLDVTGYRTTNGQKKNDNAFSIADRTQWPAKTLQDAGAIILGKLNMHELGVDTTNLNPNWGTPRNPHNDQYFVGGSSGASAYVVSAGLVPISVGSDGGGSIRIPSSFCGVYGLKPSHSRLEDTNSTVTVHGPIAATVSDLEIAYRIMAQPDLTDPKCALFAAPCCKPSADRPKIIGIYKEWWAHSDPAVSSVCNDVVTYYKEKLGYTVVDITIPYIPEGQLAHAFTILSEMAVRAITKAPDPNNWLRDLNPANQALLSAGATCPAHDYHLAQQMRNMLMQHLAFLYEQHPGLVIVTPTTPIPGWEIEQEGDLKYGVTDGNKSLRNISYVWLANFCGNPAITCPVGYVKPVKGDGNVPVGIMAMGEWGSELNLLEWGKDCETWLNEIAAGGRQRPRNWEDVIANAKGKMVA